MMKSSTPLYTFYKNKYGSELLIDIVALKDIKKYLAGKAVHTLTYYDITFITEGEGRFVNLLSPSHNRLCSPYLQG